MHIAIDASRATVANPTGTERYALEMIRALVALNETLPTPHHITLYFRDAPAPDLFPSSAHVAQRVIPLRRLWTHLGFAAALWQDRPNVVWVPAHTLPFVFPSRAVTTVHDLGYKVYPTAHKRTQRLLLEIYTRFSAWRATLVIADSAATRDDLTRFYRTPSHKIHVVYPSANPPPVGDLDAVRARYQIPERYWLYVGTLQPRKNIARIVGAFQQWQLDQPQPCALVLAGGRGWKFDERWLTGQNIIETGYISEVEKGALMAGALGLLFPSLYEGFGFPVLEAMQLGLPVICSDTSSLPEVGGDAALYVRSDNVTIIADRMIRLTESDALRQAMIARGYAQAERFSWQTAAQQALHVLESAAR